MTPSAKKTLEGRIAEAEEALRKAYEAIGKIVSNVSYEGHEFPTEKGNIAVMYAHRCRARRDTLLEARALLEEWVTQATWQEPEPYKEPE